MYLEKFLTVGIVAYLLLFSMHPTRRDFLVGSASALLLDSVLAQTNDPLGKFMQEHQIAPSPREGAPLSSKNIITNTRNSVEGVIVVEK